MKGVKVARREERERDIFLGKSDISGEPRRHMVSSVIQWNSAERHSDLYIYKFNCCY